MPEDDGSARVDGTTQVQLGTNQSGMRAQNERLVLSLVRRRGPLAKMEIARITGLSAQTVSVIMRKLEADRLLKRGEPVRGRVGQPSVPLSLDPDGAYFLGAKVGRRSLDVVLVDFAGGIRHRTTEPYDFPAPQHAIDRIRTEAEACAANLGSSAGRIAGLGLAMPFEMWSWVEETGAPDEASEAWRRVDIRGALEAALPYPVYVCNDATAACGAELAFGSNGDLGDFVYFYVGALIGGGVVLNGALYTGRSANAAALGSMPVPDGAGGSVQLIDRASLVLLERDLDAAGLPGEALYGPSADWAGYGAHLDAWIATAGRCIAHAIAAAAAVIDFEAAVIDGTFPPQVRERLIAETAAALAGLDLTGITAPDLRPGTIGPIARALGGASLPLFDRYLLDQNALTGAATRPV